MSEALARGLAGASGSGYRIGTAERDRVRDLLERHAADGRLSLDEFGERIDEVLRARTAVDLDHALRELPPVPADPRRQPRGLPRAEAAWALARPVRAVAPVLAVAVLVIAVLSVVGALWPLWILLLVTKFVFIGSRRGGAPWAGAHRTRHRAHRRHTGDDPSSPSQTRWV